MNDVIRTIEERKIIVIVRQLYGEEILSLAAALYKGGIRLMEVTVDQGDPDGPRRTAEAIAGLRAAFGADMLFGAGTVLTPAQVDAVHQAGAQYIISPNINEEVVARTKQHGLVSIPGAMTPSEIIRADQCGADFVKIFPYIDLGPAYVKNIRGPINHVKFLATGGVNEENFGEVLACGFTGAGISGRLTDKKLIAAKDFGAFTQRAGAFAAIAQAAKGGV